MSQPTREEIDASLETIEVRMDGRVAAINAKIDTFIAHLTGQQALSDARMAQIESSVAETNIGVKALRGTILLTAISTVLAIVLGVAAFNATVLSNMLASFESGKNAATAQTEVKRQTEETAALLKRMQDELNSRPPVNK